MRHSCNRQVSGERGLGSISIRGRFARVGCDLHTSNTTTVHYPTAAMLFGNRSVDLGKSTDPNDDLYEDFNYR